MNGEIRTSVAPGSDRLRVPSGASRQVRYGDKIYVRIVNIQQCWRTIAEFELDNAGDMSDVIGELRYRTRGEKGLTRLYVRNATRGWSFEQPFKLYGRQEPMRTSVRRMVQTSPQSSEITPSGHRIPESVRMLYNH